MSPRSRALVLLSLLLLLSASASAQRHRAVRSPAPQCTFSLSSSLGDPVSEGGVIRGVVRVTPIPASCTSWAAFSTVDWISIDTDAQNAYVTITPNPTNQVRTALITIAGVQMQINQVGNVVVSPPEVNLLQNGRFNADLSFWGWQDRFPNGTGAASWSSLDSANSITSGSMRLTDDISSTNAYQQSQCVRVTPGMHQYGFTVRANTTTGVQPVIAVVQFATTDCSGPYPGYQSRNSFVAQAGVWEPRSFTVAVTEGKQSILVVLGAWARQAGTQEVWIDDVFVRPQS